MYHILLPSFEGPLDLLLQLIEREELDITTIALAHVADQYLSYVRTLDTPDPRQLAEFVALAARLLLIKSRVLLPRRASPDAERLAIEADAAELAQQLRLYRQYQEAAHLLRRWYEEDRRAFVRTAALPISDGDRVVALDHTVYDLVAAVQRRLQLLLPLDDTQSLVLPPRLTVADVIRSIDDHLRDHEVLEFDTLLQGTSTRQEVIVCFWAVLELWKRHAIVLEQATLFAPISIVRPQSPL